MKKLILVSLFKFSSFFLENRPNTSREIGSGHGQCIDVADILDYNDTGESRTLREVTVSSILYYVAFLFNCFS